MKFYPSILLSLLSIIVLSPLNVFACACCADPGYYKISVRKPGSFELGELKKLKFSEARLYSTASFPEDIRGLSKPSDENYEISGEISSSGWDFNLKNKNGESGMLNFKMPKKFVDFAVDTRNGKKGGAGSTMLYKEWRFKYKVKDGSGIFKDGIKGKTEYFLVLQGKGNVCTSAEDFTDWRLEITGKKANYAFYGKLKSKEAAEVEAASRTKSLRDFKKKTKSKNFLQVSNLLGSNYSGCGCSGWKRKSKKSGENENPIFWSEFKQAGKNETLFMNLDGKDTELKLLAKGKRPAKEKIGDKFTDEYLAPNGTKVILEYATKKLPCEECEGTDYTVIATVVGEFSGKVLTLDGSCGC